jgi:Cu(I)/Ag(I) efflux system protein CusF
MHRPAPPPPVRPASRRRLLAGLAAWPLVWASSTVVAATASSADAQGEVTRVDRAGGRVGIRHGEIAALDLPPMTMNYRVRDAALLAGIEVGDRVRFTLQREGGSWVLTRLQKL